MYNYSEYQKLLKAIANDIFGMEDISEIVKKLQTVCRVLDGIPSCYHKDAIMAAFNVNGNNEEG